MGQQSTLIEYNIVHIHGFNYNSQAMMGILVHISS